MKKLGKKGKMQYTERGFVYGAGVVLLLGIVLYSMGVGQLTVTPGDVDDVIPSVGACTIDDISIDVITTDRYSGSDVNLCGVVEKKSSTGAWIRLTDIATTGDNDIVGSPGDEYRMWVLRDANTDGDFTCGVTPASSASDYQAAYIEYTAICKSTDEVAIEAVKEITSAPTLEVFDSAYNQVNSALTTNWTIAAGTTDTVTVKIKTVADTCYGQMIEDSSFTGLDYGAIACISYNGSHVDKLELRKKGTGTELATTGNPSSTMWTISNSTYDKKCWEVDANLCDGVTVEYDLWMDSDDDDAPDHYMNFTMFDVMAFEDADNKNAITFGVEDEENNDVGYTTAVSTLIYM